jgi:hypothetical protein
MLDDTGVPSYSVILENVPVLTRSSLGIMMEDDDFTSDLSMAGEPEVGETEYTYTLVHGKKKEAHYRANSITYHLENRRGNRIDIIFQVSDNGVVFRYFIPGNTESAKKILTENTGFNFPDGTTAWIQPRARSKTGWNGVNPSYEEHYWQDTLLSQITVNDSGWVFPALFKVHDAWVNITETWPDRNYCGSHLNKGDDAGEMRIAFPETSEGFTDGIIYPESGIPWATPWRVITVGNYPGDILESTLGTDVAQPPASGDFSYVKPGRASWSWALGKDPSVNYPRQKEFIDYAARMKWEYCLIDVNWDTTIGWDKLKDLVDYAASKEVGIIVWYSSSGSWNTVPYHPKDKLLTKESRAGEFSRLKAVGVKGVKVDFFGGDGQSMMDYYQDILEDAHAYQLMVNCHGSTLPRGLHRTYPNLVSMESVRGFEYATFGQETADRVPTKSTILPFTRNIFDPMDFTPVCFNEYDNNKRITGNGAELAQAVIFVSGVQHYAESPEGMTQVPVYVRKLMSEIPNSWDDTKFIDGYPGRFIVLARRSDEVWYVAGINGSKDVLDLNVELPFQTNRNGLLVSEGETLRTFRLDTLKLNGSGSFSLRLDPFGGFVAKF